MFEDYKKRSEEESRYGRIALCAFVGSVIYIAVIVFVSGAHEADTPPNHTASLNDREPAALDAEKLCASLPLPEKLEFAGKTEPKNDYEMHLVIYDYNSPRRPEEILPVFLLWLNENGWQQAPTAESIFRKGNFSIYLSHHSDASMTNYKIYCSEKK